MLDDPFPFIQSTGGESVFTYPVCVFFVGDRVSQWECRDLIARKVSNPRCSIGRPCVRVASRIHLDCLSASRSRRRGFVSKLNGVHLLAGEIVDFGTPVSGRDWVGRVGKSKTLRPPTKCSVIVSKPTVTERVCSFSSIPWTENVADRNPSKGYLPRVPDCLSAVPIDLCDRRVNDHHSVAITGVKGIAGIRGFYAEFVEMVVGQ